MSNASQSPKAKLVKFNETKRVFERIHLDFAGPFHGKCFLVMVDAFSKWPEVAEVSKMDYMQTIEKLREWFARFGLPDVIISDNGRQFTSDAFLTFCKNNGIEVRTSSPYHPATNGAAEYAVKSFKNGLIEAIADDRNSSTSLQTLLSRYLFTYRNTAPTPANLMLSRDPTTRLDFLRKSDTNKMRLGQIENYGGTRDVTFKMNEVCYVRDYRDLNKSLWKEAIVKVKLGERTYVCSPVYGEHLVWKRRHVDQMLKVGRFFEDRFNEIDCPNKIENICSQPVVIQPPKVENCFTNEEQTVSMENVTCSSPREVPQPELSIARDKPKKNY